MYHTTHIGCQISKIYIKKDKSKWKKNKKQNDEIDGGLGKKNMEKNLQWSLAG